MTSKSVIAALSAGDKGDFRCGLSSLVNCPQRSGNSAGRIGKEDFMGEGNKGNKGQSAIG